jgi:hypothetical protein
MVTIIGQITKTTPRFEIVVEWVKQLLHNSLVFINMIGNGFFKATFSNKEGQTHTLHNAFKMQNKEVFFSTCHPGFFNDIEKTLAFFKFPIWI